MRENIGPALGKILSGLYVVTANHDGKRLAMLASFIEQAAFNPPLISFAIGRERPMLQAIEAAGLFGVNILGKDNHAILRAFVKPDGEDPFAGHELVENSHGVPQLAEVVSFLVCKPVNRIEAGDHWLLLAEVLDGSLQHPDHAPMSRIRRNGFDY